MGEGKKVVLAEGVIPCECCLKAPGLELVGGVVDGINGQWLVCPTCKPLVKEQRTRLCDRRQP